MTSSIYYGAPEHNHIQENFTVKSQSADELKDGLEIECENTVSPVLLADMDTPSTIANKDEIKQRHLVQVYDVEEHCASMSATKVHKSSEMQHVNSNENK